MQQHFQNSAVILKQIPQLTNIDQLYIHIWSDLWSSEIIAWYLFHLPNGVTMKVISITILIVCSNVAYNTRKQNQSNASVQPNAQELF